MTTTTTPTSFDTNRTARLQAMGWTNAGNGKWSHPDHGTHSADGANGIARAEGVGSIHAALSQSYYSYGNL